MGQSSARRSSWWRSAAARRSAASTSWASVARRTVAVERRACVSASSRSRATHRLRGRRTLRLGLDDSAFSARELVRRDAPRPFRLGELTHRSTALGSLLDHLLGDVPGGMFGGVVDDPSAGSTAAYPGSCGATCRAGWRRIRAAGRGCRGVGQTPDRVHGVVVRPEHGRPELLRGAQIGGDRSDALGQVGDVGGASGPGERGVRLLHERGAAIAQRAERGAHIGVTTLDRSGLGVTHRVGGTGERRCRIGVDIGGAVQGPVGPRRSAESGHECGAIAIAAGAQRPRESVPRRHELGRRRPQQVAQQRVVQGSDVSPPARWLRG